MIRMINSTHVKKDWGRVLDGLPEHKEAVIVIRYSAPVAILLDYGEWCRMMERIEALGRRVLDG